VIAFPVIQHLSSLLWVVNLGCIDLNPWYARCDDVDRPDYLHFDLDPVVGASFKGVLETALKNVPARLGKIGDLWKPLLEEKNRVDLKAFL